MPDERKSGPERQVGSVKRKSEMKMVTWVSALGRLSICAHGRPSLRQTKGKSLEVIVTAERTSVDPH